jgi:hypothetical protein
MLNSPGAGRAIGAGMSKFLDSKPPFRPRSGRVEGGQPSLIIEGVEVLP